MGFLKDTYRSPLFFIIRMGIVYLIGKYLITFYNEMSFDWSEEVATASSWILILYFVYVIASVIPPSESETTPLFTQEHTRKIINKQYEYLGKPIFEARGLYHVSINFIDEVLHYQYNPIINPVELIHKSEAYIIVLNSLNTGSADKLILYLEKVISEAKYMLANECTTLVVKR